MWIKKYIFIELLTQKGITISYFCNVLSIYIYIYIYIFDEVSKSHGNIYDSSFE